MTDRKIYFGWFLALFGVLVIEGLSKVFIAYGGQILHSNPLVFTCVTFNASALTLLLIGGHGALSKETMRSLETWAYGLVMLALYIIAFLLFREAGATEGGFLQRISVLFSVVAGWLFWGRSFGLLQKLAVTLTFAGIVMIVFNTSSDKLGNIILLIVLWGFFHAIRVFIAEFHKPHTAAMQMEDPKSRCRVVGFVMFAVSIFFTIITLFLSGINSFSQSGDIIPIIPHIADFTDTSTILVAMFVGVAFTAPLRLIEFTSTNTIKSENFLAISCFACLATLFWEWLSSSITGMTLKEFTTQDLMAGLIITLGGLAMVWGNFRKAGSSDEMLKKYLCYAGQNLEAVEDSREILANTLEHFSGDVKKSAKALGVTQTVLEAMLIDKEKVLAFRKEIRPEVARNYRKQVAMADGLTGLANRSTFMTALHSAAYEAEVYSVLYLDLNKFKPVNDTYGHEAGDKILQGVAERLQKIAPKSSVITRMGGDEYCMLLLNVSKEDAQKLATQVQSAITKPFKLEGIADKIEVTASAGIATYPEDSDNPADLLQIADKGMFSVKQSRDI